MTNFNPELVTRVGQAILNAAFASAFETHKTVVDQRAIAALEASGIAELTEKAKALVEAIYGHDQSTEVLIALGPFETALAKIGGNHG